MVPLGGRPLTLLHCYVLQGRAPKGSSLRAVRKHPGDCHGQPTNKIPCRSDDTQDRAIGNSTNACLLSKSVRTGVVEEIPGPRHRIGAGIDPTGQLLSVCNQYGHGYRIKNYNQL